jgi:hypothetical protein
MKKQCYAGARELHLSVDYPSQQLGESHDYVEIGQEIGRKITIDK